MTLQKSHKTNAWSAALINAVTDPEELFQLLALDPQFLPQAKAAMRLFPLKAPREWIGRMQKGNINDPLLRQILPIGLEWKEQPGFSTDPLGEKNANPVPGLLHKYQGRVLLTLTSACGIHCRFCFRKHFPYADNTPGKNGWERILGYIAKDPSIQEVILSGGDPLVLNDVLLAEFTQQLAKIAHVKWLRIHSRMPIVVPERITEELLQWLAQPRFKAVLVVHCNHPQEINDKVRQAMKRLVGVTLLNQSVLLKGVNDQIETLVLLSHALFEAGILPYYLNLLDPVHGTAHFEVPEAEAKRLYRQMLERLPGYLVPRWVRETEGGGFKAPLPLIL